MQVSQSSNSRLVSRTVPALTLAIGPLFFTTFITTFVTTFVTTLSVTFLTALSAPAATKPVQPVVRRLGAAAPVSLKSSQANNPQGAALRAAQIGDTCSAYMGGDPFWIISGWVIGQESYKAYQDPEQICPGAYPFSIESAHMFWQISDTVGLTPYGVNVFVEILDLDSSSTPQCPVPGNPLFIGSAGTVTIPTPGFYDIEIPLDAPFEVNGPYFVAVTFSDTIPADLRLDLVTDAFETLCVSYNIWDTAIGDVDLGDDAAVRPQVYPPGWCCLTQPFQESCFESNLNPPGTIGCFDFDGRVLLWSFGRTGGVPPDPQPAVAFLSPLNNDKLFASTDIWLAETAGSSIVDSAVFYYKGAGAWTRIGVDGNPALATGLGVPGPGDGLSYYWDFGALAEGTYWIKAEIYDTLNQVGVDSIQVTLEPTPPVGTLQSPPDYFDRFCDSLSLVYDVPDENLSFAVLEKKLASMQYSKALQTLNQFTLGDTDGDSADGNPASQGEFGDYYGAPVAGVLCMRYWHGQGFVNALRIGPQEMTNVEASERLAGFMLIKQDSAAPDERAVLGLREYFQLTGFNELKADVMRNPSYSDLRNRSEDFGAATMLAISGKKGRWVAVDGFDGIPALDGTRRVIVSDPADGLKKTMFWRETGSVAEVFIEGQWRTVDVMIMISPTSWQPTGRQNIGFDTPSGGQTSFVLNPGSAGLTDGNLYFISTEISDVEGNLGRTTFLFEYNCASFAPGDYNGDGNANISDLIYLLAFQNLGGPAPVGGAGRADANCDSKIDLVDPIYWIAWLFSSGPPPCQ